jgi:molybdopterin converting factor small subunit
MPRVVVPPPYRGPTGGEAEIDVEGETVGACLRSAAARFPGFSEQIFDAAGRVHRFVNLFVNGEEIERQDLSRPVRDGDRVEILAAIAGGAAAGPDLPGAPRALVFSNPHEEVSR